MHVTGMLNRQQSDIINTRVLLKSGQELDNMALILL